MNFIRVAAISEVPVGSKQIVMLGNDEILLANIENTFYAISNKCPHAGASLAECILDGYIITCPEHHAKFDIRTGKTVSRGKLGFLQFNVNDNISYSVKIEGTDILIAKS